MRSRFASDPQDPIGDLGMGDSIPSFGAGFLTSSNYSGSGDKPAQPIAPTLPDESFEAMAAVSGSGSGGLGSVVAVTSSSGFTINLNFDAAAMAAPASFRAGIQQAAAILSATITNKITVNINIDYSGTGGGAAAGPDNGQFVNYSTVRSDLIANAAPGDTSFNSLPTGSTIQGQSSVAVWNAQLKLFGLMNPNDTTTDDASATFATDINPGLLVGVALHELTHAIGRVPYGPQPDIFDFYRFTSVGTRLFTDNIPAASSYFSLNGGTTKIADIGTSSDPSDFLNSGVQGGNDPFNEFYSGSTIQTLTTIDKEMLDALGFNTMPAGIAVVANPAQALQGGNAMTLLSSAPAISDPGTLASATIKIANPGGSAVAGDKLFVNGIQNGALGNGVTASWNSTTDTLTLTGIASVSVYDTLLSQVAFQDTGTDASSGSHPVRTVTWTINDGTNSFNTTSQVSIDRAPVVTNDTAADTVGTTLTANAASGVLSNDSDLDHDTLSVTAVSHSGSGGTIGSALAGTYGHLTLNANGAYSYTADNTAALNGAPTGAHLQDSFAYTASDGNGGSSSATLAITLDRPPVVTAANVALGAGNASVAATSLYTSFDPDGNTIATYAFMDTGNGHFVLNGVVQANNQEIDVTAAQLSQLTYQSVPGASADRLEVRVNDGTLWSNWTSFTVTPAPLVIQTDGSTTLVEVGNDYFLYNTISGTGPELAYAGAPFTAGAYGGWTAIGAIQVAGGYDVALKNVGAGQYTVWSTDSSGNYLSSIVAPVPGSNTALQSIETLFNQDLNSDGHIGPPPPPPPPPPIVIQTDGSTTLVEVGNDYFLYNTISGTGPELAYAGAPFTAGAYGGWTAIGAIQVAGGYDVALKNVGAGQYTVWSTDSSGNYLSSIVAPVPGSNTALQSIETLFNQDLNSDGHIGPPPPPPPPPPIVIQTDGSTTLVEVGNDYFLYNTISGTGPELAYAGAPFTAGAYGGWTAIGAIQVAGGYDVALKNVGAGQYTVWSTDSSGNYLSSIVAPVPGSNTALQSIETLFNQDLNSDGHIGPPPPPPPPPPIVIQTDGSTTLVEVGNDYFLYNTISGTGPELAYAGAPFTAGAYGGWTAIGAIQVAGGYDVALKNVGAGQYTVWSTDSSGNYLSSIVAPVPGSNTALQSIETLFNQDLNSDGHIGLYAAAGTTLQINSPQSATSGSATIGTAATLELGAADSASVTFSSSTGMLKLDAPSTFSGMIFNFAGNGSLSGSDQIDLKGVNFNSVHDTYANGVLTITDGTHTDTLNFNGSYALANFKFANDGSGGTIVYDPPVPTSNPSAPTSSAVPAPVAALTNPPNDDAPRGATSDTFVFDSNFGQNTIHNFDPNHGTVQIDHRVFSGVAAQISHTSDNSAGNAVVVADGHDTMTIMGVTTNVHQHHLHDFIIT